MRRRNGRPPGLSPCFVPPKPRPGRGNFNGRGRVGGDGGSRTQARPPLPPHLRKDAGKQEDGGREDEKKDGAEEGKEDRNEGATEEGKEG